MALEDYIRLIRFKYHVTFISVVLGALLFADGTTMQLLKSIALLYLSFNVLLYGGIYTLNDVADFKSDSRHPLKRNRPLPSGRVSVKAAYLFAVALIVGGLLTGFLLFRMEIFLIYLATLALNIFYTFAAKKVPYLELFVNSATHPLRFFMGVLLVSNAVPYLLLLAVFAIAFGLACVRRVVEMDVKGWEIRSVLKAYSARRLLLLQVMAFLSIIAAATADATTVKAYYAVIAAAYLVLVFGIYFSVRIRGFFRHVWTR